MISHTLSCGNRGRMTLPQGITFLGVKIDYSVINGQSLANSRFYGIEFFWLCVI